MRREPRAGRGLLRRLPDRRRARRPFPSSSRRSRRTKGLPAPRAPPRLRRLPGNLRPVALRRRLRRRPRRRRTTSERARRAREGARASGSRSSRPTSIPKSRWSRPSTSSRTGSASRSCAAARRAAASARRATGTGPCASWTPPTSRRPTKAFIDEAGWSEVGLLSLSSADYSQIEPLVACLAPELAKTKVSISLPSLRAEAFSVAPRGRRLRGAQVGLHVRARDRLGPPPPRHQQDLHERRHGEGRRRRLRARLGPDQGLHDDRPPDGDRGRTSTSS